MDARNDKLSIPPEATNALPLLKHHLGSSLAAVYLHGSAVAEGLRKRSDVDLLVIVSKALSAPVRARLSADLMKVSGLYSPDPHQKPTVSFPPRRRPHVRGWGMSASGKQQTLAV